MAARQSAETISTKQERIADLARRIQGEAVTSLSHHMDEDWLQEAYRRTRKGGAVGVDGQTAQAYAADLEENLRSLLGRAKAGHSYRAPPVRRVHIPKGDGKTRPIGVPTFEDKVLQRAVHMLVSPVYEQEFYDCSYGFRPGRSAHDALQALWDQTTIMRGGWLLEADIKSFFDDVDHQQLQGMLRQRIRDGVVLRLIGKWLKAGVMEEGCTYHPEAGTPQGGVISPLLANVYLHEVLDKWFHEVVRPRLEGRAFLVRFADDFVVCFERENDARRVLDVLPKRFGKYGLRLHPEKTRLVEFNRPNDTSASRRARPGAFDFLGFTHFWGRSRKGGWVVKRKTMSTRFSRTLKTLGGWMRDHRHLPVHEQHSTLTSKLNGHYGYYGITGNGAMLQRLNRWAERLWQKWLSRRSHRGKVTWEQMKTILRRHPLPRPRVVHSVYAT